KLLQVSWNRMTETAYSMALPILFLANTCLALLLAYRIDINQFSMHLLYRNRLVRCYLGASNRKPPRKAQPFTGFDRNDDIGLHEVWEPRVLPIMVGIRKTPVEVMDHDGISSDWSETD